MKALITFIRFVARCVVMQRICHRYVVETEWADDPMMLTRCELQEQARWYEQCEFRAAFCSAENIALIASPLKNLTRNN